MKLKRCLLCALALLVAGCQPAAPEETAPPVDCATVTVPTFNQLTIMNSCNVCHASGLTGAYRRGAPEGVDYDTYDAAVDEAFTGAVEVYVGKMPFTGTVTEEEKQAFYAWAMCGTPR